jgi:hypothetical protein
MYPAFLGMFPASLGMFLKVLGMFPASLGMFLKVFMRKIITYIYNAGMYRFTVVKDFLCNFAAHNNCK